MYETTISAPFGDKHILNYIKRLTANAVNEMDAISSETDSSARSYFAVACSDTFRFQMKRVLTNSVSSAISMGYKNIFVRNCLKVSKGTFFQNVLINTMCVFDREFDRQAVERVVDVDKPICLDGYYNFKLSSLKKKWSEIAGLVSENGYILRDPQLIIEFLQYLMDSVTCKISEITVSFEENGFWLYDSKNNVLPVVDSLARDPSTEEEVAINIILLKPKSVKVYSGRSPSNDFCRFLKLFDSTIKIVD